MRGRKKKVTDEDIRKACDKWLREHGVVGPTFTQGISRDAKRGAGKPRRSKIDQIAEDLENKQ